MALELKTNTTPPTSDVRLIEIRKLQRKVAGAAAELESAKEVAKACKDVWETLVEVLGNYIRGADPVLPLETVDETTGEVKP